MNAPSLFERLPEVYRQRDAEQSPPGQLEALVDALDSVFSALRDRVEQQYDDLFIEICDDWVVPYIADLVGTSHLKGDPRTLRADVARTVYHRRRKGTLGAIESQAFALSGWAAHAVELRDRLAWNMHLNHLRPDAGGASPWQSAPHNDPRHPLRGGTAALRAPAWLSFVDDPFDPFARTVDLKPPVAREGEGPARPAVNLPNLGVFLWRLEDYQVPVSLPAPPRAPAAQVVAQADPASAPFAVRFELHPQGEPLVLFNTHRFHADDEPPNLADIDSVPNPMPPARLTTDAPAGRPEAYVEIDLYTGVQPERPSAGAPGLVLHLPDADFGGLAWRLRGANLCGWEAGLAPPLAPLEIAIDPKRGRVVFGVPGPAQADFADPLVAGLRVSATTGFSGPVGAQPVPHRIPAPSAGTTVLRITRADGPDVLALALADLALRATPLVIEIADSLTHELDLNGVPGVGNDAGTLFLRIAQPLTICALDGERPVIRLAQPLRLRAATIASGGSTLQSLADVAFSGLYLTRGAAFGAGDALIEQAALNTLAFDRCTLDPGGAQVLDGSVTGGRAPLRAALHLANGYGLSDPIEAADFTQVPQLVFKRCISGALLVDTGYSLSLDACIVDAGSGVGAATPALAIGAAAGTPDDGWGPALVFEGLTVFGRTRVERARGAGGIFVHRLQVHDNQDSHGALAAPNLPGSCIQRSWFAGLGDRLPQHVACVFGTQAPLRFVAQRFGAPGYAQLAWESDRRVREAGPNDDEMGAFGFLLNAHKWKNICIRLREFMPVGNRALLVNVT